MKKALCSVCGHYNYNFSDDIPCTLCGTLEEDAYKKDFSVYYAIYHLK